MRYAFLLSDDLQWVGSIRRRLTSVHHLPPRLIHRLDWGSDSPGGNNWIIQRYARYVDEIEAVIAADGLDPSALRGSLGAIDLGAACVVPADIDAMSEEAWPTLVGMLVMTFPEIHWVFRTPFRASHRSWADEAFAFDYAHVCDSIDALDRTVALLATGHQALFDPTGLRDGCRERLETPPPPRTSREAIKRPRRTAVAVSIDEEEGYAFFTAYTAYRIGYRAHVLTSYSLLKTVLAPTSERTSILPKVVDTAFEDVYLNFPDRPLATHLSDFERRARDFPKLHEARHRILVSSGGHGTRSPAELSQTTPLDEYVGKLKNRKVHVAKLAKPLSGFYRTWSDSGLKELFKENNGYAPKFDPKQGWYNDPNDEGHSTPGRLYAVAVNLLRRSDRLERSACSVPDMLHAALLALDAQEILATRTPTTSLEAIAQKHNMEVRAECTFHGLTRYLDVKARDKEVRDEIEGVSQFFPPTTRPNAALHARAQILGSLMQRYRDADQYDEEQCVLAMLRDTHRQMGSRKYPVIGRALDLVPWYAHLLLKSPRNFIVALAGWTAVFWIAFLFDPGKADLAMLERWAGAAYDSAMTFISAQPPGELHKRSLGLSAFATLGIFVSMFHLGIFVSYLYGVVARR